jgi:hypothetical protein
MLKIPHYPGSRLRDGGKVISLTRRPHPTPREIFFSVRCTAGNVSAVLPKQTKQGTTSRKSFHIGSWPYTNAMTLFVCISTGTIQHRKNSRQCRSNTASWLLELSLELGSPNFFSLRATLNPPLSPKGQDLASSSYQHTVVLNYAHIFVLGLAGEWDIYGAGRGGKLCSVRKFSSYLRASVKDTRNIWLLLLLLLFCMIYLHCKFYSVIKINYGGPDTGHVRPAVLAGRCWPAGRSLETPGLEDTAFIPSVYTSGPRREAGPPLGHWDYQTVAKGQGGGRGALGVGPSVSVGPLFTTEVTLEHPKSDITSSNIRMY